MESFIFDTVGYFVLPLCLKVRSGILLTTGHYRTKWLITPNLVTENENLAIWQNGEIEIRLSEFWDASFECNYTKIAKLATYAYIGDSKKCNTKIVRKIVDDWSQSLLCYSLMLSCLSSHDTETHNQIFFKRNIHILTFAPEKHDLSVFYLNAIGWNTKKHLEKHNSTLLSLLQLLRNTKVLKRLCTDCTLTFAEVLCICSQFDFRLFFHLVELKVIEEILTLRNQHWHQKKSL